MGLARCGNILASPSSDARRTSRVGFLFLVLFFAQQAAFSQPFNPEELKSVKIYFTDGSRSVHDGAFEETASYWFRQAGVEVAGVAGHSENSLTIEANMKSLSADYKEMQSGKSVKLHTGYRMDGAIRLQTRGGFQYYTKFKGETGPSQLTFGLGSVPFEETLYAPGSYVYAVAKMLSELYGIDVLIKGSAKANAANSTLARTLIKEYGSKAVTPLLAALSGDAAPIRRVAIFHLSALKDSRSIEPIIAALKDPDKTVRSAAATVLGDLNDSRAVEPLGQILNDETEVAVPAAKSLGKLKDARAIPALISAVRQNSRRQHSSQYDKDGSLPPVFAASFSALGEIGQPAMESILPFLFDPNPELRAEAIRHVGKPGNTKALGPLIVALEDDRTAPSAAIALAGIGDKQAVSPLIKVTRGYRAAGTNAMQALGVLTGMNFGTDTQAVSKWAQWWESNKANFPAPVGPLLPLLTSEDAALRKNALIALGDLRDPRAFDVLVAALKDDREIAEHAARFLGLMKDARAVPYLLEAARTNGLVKAVWAMGEAGPPAFDSLVLILQDQNPRMRQAAVSPLAKIDKDRAKPLLIAALKDEIGVASAAAITLAEQFHDKTLIPDLISAMNLQNERQRLGPYHGLLVALRILTKQPLPGTETVDFWNLWWEQNKQNYSAQR